MGSFTRARADQRGFTLAELLVAIAIIALIMTGLLTLLKKGNESYLAGANQVEAQAAVRAALERMTTDIREAGYAPCTGPPTPPAPPPCANWGGAIPAAITNQTPTSFTIQNDWDASGAIEPANRVCINYTWSTPCPAVGPPPAGAVVRGEQITYTVNLAAGTLTRQESAVDAQPQTLVTSVQQAARGQDCLGVQILNPPFFQYCDPDPISGNIRTVVVSLQAGVQNQPPAIWQAGAIQVTMSDRIRLRNRL